jgi:translation initiation factor IF-3
VRHYQGLAFAGPFFHFVRRCFPISKKEHEINEDIRDAKVRLIDADGAQLGIVNGRDALEKAFDAGFDLVKIAPTASPPVCRIMDYGKFRFEQAKRDKESKKHQRIVEVKGIELSPNIDVHDVNFKMRAAQRFLREGNKLKVFIRFRGRQMAHPKLGEEQMLRFAEGLTDEAVIDKPPKLDGRLMTMFMSPKPETKVKEPKPESTSTKE